MTDKAKRLMAKQEHEMSINELSLFNSGYRYSDGYDRAICTCGWQSAAVQRDKQALAIIFAVHADAARQGKDS